MLLFHKKMRRLLIAFLLVAVATCAVVDINTEEEALEYISKEENGTEENVKELIVKVRADLGLFSSVLSNLGGKQEKRQFLLLMRISSISLMNSKKQLRSRGTF